MASRPVAPALYWPDLFAAAQWPQQVLDTLGVYPYGYELDAITAAAIAACNGLDGAVDSVIADVDTCLGRFNPLTLVNSTVGNCPQAPPGRWASIRVSREAAVVASAA